MMLSANRDKRGKTIDLMVILFGGQAWGRVETCPRPLASGPYGKIPAIALSG